MKIAIQIILGNFQLVMLIISLGIAFSKREGFFKRLLFSVLMLNVGLCGIWGFFIHGFFSDIISNYLGWVRSPFEYEVSIANLGIGVTGIIAAFSSYNYKKATITFVSIFLIGTAFGHIYQIYTAYRPNSGHLDTTLWADILVTIFLWIALLASKKTKEYGFIASPE